MPALPAAPDAVTATTGAVAVNQSKANRAQQEASRIVANTSSSVVRNMSNKTFYLRNGVWNDAEFKQDTRLPETILTFGSDEYFALLKREPKLAEFFALGERVVVVFNKRVYRVNAASN